MPSNGETHALTANLEASRRTRVGSTSFSRRCETDRLVARRAWAPREFHAGDSPAVL
jgi:hypothetical protein